ncbi:hypothetical protein JB92DRAFT_2831423 [Gautieria morchelliformis]|nr:hypothetical protein JB92DRAFT_2831423 [Gautieria morchelliformis]
MLCVFDSSDEEIQEMGPLPFKSSSGRVVKPSAALLHPSNAAKVPGQPHGTRRLGEAEEPKRRKPKPTVAKPTGKQKDKEVPVPVPTPVHLIQFQLIQPYPWQLSLMTTPTRKGG